MKQQNQISKDNHESTEKDPLAKNLPFYNLLNLDRLRNFLLFVVIRIYMETYFSQSYHHPDEFWQGSQVAYGLVYGGVNLSWEWKESYRMRNILYPAYLSIPLWILKSLGLDYQPLVVYGPYMFHCVLVCIGDYYFYQACKKIIGIQAARVSFVLYLSNHFFTYVYIHAFTNSVEAILNIVAMNYFYDISNKFDKNLKIVTACLTLGFGIRNTCIIGWVPILVLKMLEKRAVVSFIKTFLLVYIPVQAFVILADSLYYDELTSTAFNFLKHNILDNKSEIFGVSEPGTYIFVYFPLCFRELFYIMVPSLFYHIFVCLRHRTIPYLPLFAGLSLLVVSLVPHKEMRFMLPFMPFIFMILGQFITLLIKPRFIGKLFGVLLLIFAAVNLQKMYNHHHYETVQEHQVLQYILENDPNPHSVSIQIKFTVPPHTYLHRHPSQKPIKVNVADIDYFYNDLLEPGKRFQLDIGHQSKQCFEILYKILTDYKPKYIYFKVTECRTFFKYCNKACEEGLRYYYDQLEIDNKLLGNIPQEDMLFKLKKEFQSIDQQ